MKRLFIINPQSGRGRGLECGKEIEEILKRGEIKGDTVYTEKPGDEKILARQAVSKGYGCLVSVGGEGTNNGIINGIAGSNTLFGMVPVGTANDFARYSGIPKDVKGALEVINQGKLITIDLGKVSGKVNQRIFLNEVSFGFTARIIQFLEDFKRRYQLLPADGLYLATSVKSFSQLEYRKVEIRISRKEFTETITREVTLVLVANGPYCGGKFRLTPQADPTDGLLYICLIDKISEMRAVEILFRAIKGKHVQLPEVKLFRASSLMVSSSEALPCEVDGEVLPAEKRYEISILPKALKVLVP